MIDYEVLRFIWWLLVGVLLIGFAVTDGFDMGVGMLTRFLGRNDTERRIMINSIAPHWDGNQVWLITAGGALFAAWPMVYAAAFSGFYVAMILVLASLFFRPVPSCGSFWLPHIHPCMASEDPSESYHTFWQQSVQDTLFRFLQDPTVP